MSDNHIILVLTWFHTICSMVPSGRDVLKILLPNERIGMCTLLESLHYWNLYSVHSSLLQAPIFYLIYFILQFYILLNKNFFSYSSNDFILIITNFSISILPRVISGGIITGIILSFKKLKIKI